MSEETVQIATDDDGLLFRVMPETRAVATISFGKDGLRAAWHAAGDDGEPLSDAAPGDVEAFLRSKGVELSAETLHGLPLQVRLTRTGLWVAERGGREPVVSVDLTRPPVALAAFHRGRRAGETARSPEWDEVVRFLGVRIHADLGVPPPAPESPVRRM